MGLLLHHAPETTEQGDAPMPPLPKRRAAALLARWLLAGVVSGVLFAYLPVRFGGWLLYGMSLLSDQHFNLLLVRELLIYALLITLLGGLAIGMPQALAARPILPAPPWAWMLTTILSVGVGFIAGYLALFLVESLAIGTQLSALVLFGACLGLGVGAAQGLLMRGGAGRVVGWAAACGLASAVAWGVELGLYQLDIGRWWWGLLPGGLGGLVFALITGPVLLRLLRERLAEEHPPLPEAEPPEPVFVPRRWAMPSRRAQGGER